MKLISINIEGTKHVNTVRAFLLKEQPDVICLQEAQKDLLPLLEEGGYTYATLAHTLRTDDTHLEEPEGLILASRYPAVFESFYYHMPEGGIQPFMKAQWRDTCAYGVIIARIQYEGMQYQIATTHFTWTPDGKPNTEQDSDLEILLSKLGEAGPHILCGDLNIPRLHNRNYQTLIEHYTDGIPSSYMSSLDRDKHRCGKSPLHTIMFDEYMVDYILSKPSYSTSDVRLEFGISDHAAIVATIQQSPT